jgi:hypothetical protein
MHCVTEIKGFFTPQAALAAATDPNAGAAVTTAEVCEPATGRGARA